jgi:AcrR family transcriptional regulator
MKTSKTQVQRRLTLITAAQSVIAKHGLPAATLGEIAREAGMTANALLYYYPGLKELLEEVQTLAVERFSSLRAAACAHIKDPRQRLKTMIETGLPAGPDDELCRLLEELSVYARSDASYAARHIVLFERQVAIYQGILEAGAATGVFKLQDASDTIARSLVLLEDGLSFHLLNVVPAVDSRTALEILKNYAELATQSKLDKTHP